MGASTQDQFAATVAAMGDVAAGGGSWSANVLAPMAALLGVEHATIDVFDKRAGAFRFLTTQPVDAGDRRVYEEHLHASNPRFTLLPRLPVGAIAADRHLDPEIDAGAGEFYDWIERAAGSRYFAGVKLIENDDYLAVSSIGATRAKGWVSPETEQVYARLAPHLANALSADLALAGRDRLDPVGADGSGRAYVFLSRDGHVLESSPALERMGAAGDALALRGRRLEGARGPNKAALAGLIANAVADDAPDRPLSPVRLQRRQPGHGVLARAIRLSRNYELFERLRPVAMLILIDLDAPLAAAQAELRAGWGLTQREAELATLIGDGCRLDRAAAMLGISAQTARGHLKAVFRRMDIERQTDLVRIVTRLGA